MMAMKQPFEAVVRAHGAAVLRVCRAVAGPDDAEDAWSETFLAALRAYPALDTDANVEAWLVTIAQRKAIDLVRANGRRRPSAATPDGVSTIGIPGSAQRDLHEAVVALPARQREAVALHYLGGLPYADVAAATGTTAAAARRAAADGIANLRKALGDEGAKRSST